MSFLRKMLVVAAMIVCQLTFAQNTPLRRDLTNAPRFNGTTAAAKAAELNDGEWVSMGTGRWRDDFVTRVFNVECLEMEVEVRKNDAYPGVYRVMAPYKDYPFTSYQEIDPESYVEVHAEDPDHVYFCKYNTGLDIDGQGALLINSIAGYIVEHESFEKAVAEGACGVLMDGVLLFAQNTLLVRTEYSEDDQWMYANMNFGGYKTGFRLVLPDAPDLELAIDVQGANEAKDVLNVRFEVGKDCEKVRVAMMPGKASNDDLQKILNGSVAYQDITKTQDVAFDYPADGVYTFYAIPYLNGVNRRVTYLTKELNYQNLGWRKLGFATYTEAFLADMEGQLIQGIEPVTYSVEIEESTETPGYFRLIDPYGDNYPYSTKNDYDNTRHYYMEIDASDPECVMIKEMSDGCGYNFGVGKMVMWSRADRELNTRGKSKEEVKEMGYFGKCENGVITFPDEMLLISFPDFYPFPYYANVSGKFRLVLPEGAGVGRIEATQTEGNEEIFDLNGRRVQRSAMTPGMYILRQNGKTTKVLY